ncbi:hypothetical protein DPMN_063461 [Dreissena polymorpha]|uniref:Uncharacterized protein n=1 Tax=Dreissena polymorpha TaxID=45954 RepID=A0A9D4CBC1_DREPO|nr:hypothetical protein DPMN_063461 [Dreissena polymorpha]
MLFLNDCRFIVSELSVVEIKNASFRGSERVCVYRGRLPEPNTEVKCNVTVVQEMVEYSGIYSRNHN